MDMNDMNKIIHSLSEALSTLQKFIDKPVNIKLIDQAATIMADCLAGGGKIISCGNGGSMCDAAHFAEELTGRYRNNRKPYPAIAINDPAYLTCVGNDFSFDEVFSRFVEATGNKNDVLLAISTSGNSENVVRAARKAKDLDMRIVSLTKEGGNKLEKISDVTIASPATPFSDRIQEIHIKVIHILIQLIEAKLGY
ncbi:D-sedoheptulose 7-phosphate isomerase [Proteiniphilum sp.]|uniref:D-sedoheptulose 7-phosphate isomerase n=1 Tax=Proteiniphilum sp. TaxID=1926877 RepID=UPI0026D6DA1C|nr:D-sedoheptulose 7-phosphate isomerase [Proteiniphilum sp.]MEA5127525.1 D-sedoheptulose 7-phosphate isomerase [Proteiniphilum sp.]